MKQNELKNDDKTICKCDDDGGFTCINEKKEIFSYLVFDLWHVMDAEHVSFGLLSNLNFPCLSSTQVHPTEQ